MHHRQPQATSALDVLAVDLLRRHLAEVRHAGRPLVVALHRDSPAEYRPEALGFDVEILGYAAASDVDAIALIATGHVRPVASNVELMAELAAAARRRIDLACVVSRDGTVAWKACAGAETLRVPTPDGGQMLDCLRRALGVPTAPPSRSPAVLEGPLWAVRLAAAAGADTVKLRWSQVVACRPSTPPRAAWRTDPADNGALFDSWERLRVAAAAGLTSMWVPPRQICEWMDAGMFSRWVAASIPSPADLTAALRDFLEPPAARRFYHELTRIAGR
ncbi:MAG: hypothetical protein ACP5P1_01835 [Acidimicrobiales bacterium]